ncbi:hypothetical protein [Oricola sp.]|uniref:hypothetical protein n=1 Tax=Oricola sp. TaxID=1979950 RepID=UPI003BA96E19
MTTIEFAPTRRSRFEILNWIGHAWRSHQQAMAERRLRLELRDCPEYLLRDMGIPVSSARMRRSGLKMLNRSVDTSFMHDHN